MFIDDTPLTSKNFDIWLRHLARMKGATYYKELSEKTNISPDKIHQISMGVIPPPPELLEYLGLSRDEVWGNCKECHTRVLLEIRYNQK